MDQLHPPSTPEPPAATRTASLARQIIEDIRRGRLRPGERIPGSRRLAEAFGVHRNTVLAALRGLEAEGWITARAGQGTFIATTLPMVTPTPFAAPAPPTRLAGYPVPEPPEDLASPPPPPSTLALLGGLPDLSATPAAALARAWRRALRKGPAVLAYGDPRGVWALRVALAELLRTERGLTITAENLVITRGSQQALFLIGQALLRPGDRVAIEALGYRPAWAALAATGATLVPIALDGDGLQVEALQAAHAEAPLRAVYLTPHHQFPTTVTLSAPRRVALLAFAAEARLAVIEDDYDHEFHYVGRPILPLASADPAGVVIHCGTFSKVFAPGLRLGYVVAAPATLDALTRWRVVVDRQGDAVGETAVAELLGDGELTRHIRRMRRIYAQRRAVMVGALRQNLSEFITFDVPPGGMALWARLADGLDADACASAAADRGVLVQPSSRFTDARDVHALRIGFASLPEARLEEAVRRLGEAVRAVAQGRN